MPVTVSLIPGPEVAALIQRLTQAQGQTVSQAAAKSLAPKLTRWLVEYTQDFVGSGPFARGWLAQPAGNGIQVTNSDPLAVVKEFPTKRHEINARPGLHAVTRKTKSGKSITVMMPYVLAWVPGRGAFSAVNASKAKGAANWIYARRVMHPGTAGKGVFPMVLKVHDDDIFQLIADAANSELSGNASPDS